MESYSRSEQALCALLKELRIERNLTQIELAKKELEEKLKVADQLHTEFDEIRDVLDGKIGALNALDKTDDPAGS